MTKFMRWIGAATLVAATALVVAPMAEAQDRWSWRHPRSSSYSYSSAYRGITPYSYGVRTPYVPYYGVGYGGVQWHNAPSYYSWAGPGYYYNWRTPGSSVYSGPGYYYQYYW